MEQLELMGDNATELVVVEYELLENDEATQLGRYRAGQLVLVELQDFQLLEIPKFDRQRARQLMPLRSNSSR